jgi:SAM-dependent methyltransferase
VKPLARLQHAPELLDARDHDRRELEQSLDHVAEINLLLGGRRAALRALASVARPGQRIDVLDIGTGSADIPLAIARRAGLAAQITATDLHPQMLEIARERTRGVAAIRVEAADALALPFADAAFDVALLSLALHHFDGADQIRVLREAARVATRAVIVNELERCRANLYGARLLAATRWRGNRLTRHDGPLSVLRAFTGAELAELAATAGLRVERIDRRFFYRLVLIADARRQA